MCKVYVNGQLTMVGTADSKLSSDAMRGALYNLDPFQQFDLRTLN